MWVTVFEEPYRESIESQDFEVCVGTSGHLRCVTVSHPFLFSLLYIDYLHTPVSPSVRNRTSLLQNSHVKKMQSNYKNYKICSRNEKIIYSFLF